MRKINLNLKPSEGYFFVERDGSRHRGGNWKAVINLVFAYRQRLGWGTDTVEEEIMAQACQRNPGYCGQVVERADRPQVSLKQRMLLWLDAMLRLKERDGPFRHVGNPEAQERADICAKCLHNVPLLVEKCSTCRVAVENYRMELIGPSRRRDSRLGGCAAMGMDNVTAVYLDETRVDNPALPAHCWRKRTL